MAGPFVPQTPIRISVIGSGVDTVRPDWFDRESMTRDELWDAICDVYERDPGLAAETEQFGSLTVQVVRVDTGQTVQSEPASIPTADDTNPDVLPIRTTIESWYTANHIPEWYDYNDTPISDADGLYQAAVSLYINEQPELADELTYDGSFRFRLTRTDTGQHIDITVLNPHEDHPTDRWQQPLT